MTTGALVTNEDKTTRVNVNLERMPLAFLGENSERIRIQKEHAGTGKRIVLFQEKEGDSSRSLSMSPSSTYGLLTGFDIDVLTVIQHKLYQITKIEGTCPLKVRLWLSEFPSIMKLQKSGGLYRRIRESIIKISETVLYHEKCLFEKNDRHSTKRLMKDDAIRIILYIRSEEEVKSGTVEFNKSFIDIEIEEWLRNNINTNYTTEIDTSIYFSLPSDRSKYFYRFLEFIRYNKEVPISIAKLEKEMYLLGIKLVRQRRRAIARAIEPLLDKKFNFIESYDLTEDFIRVRFITTKKRQEIYTPNKLSLPANTLDLEKQSLLQYMIDELKDESSRDWLTTIIQKVPDDLIYICLSLTKDTVHKNGVKKSKGAIFTDHIKRECQSRKIPF